MRLPESAAWSYESDARASDTERAQHAALDGTDHPHAGDADRRFLLDDGKPRAISPGELEFSAQHLTAATVGDHPGSSCIQPDGRQCAGHHCVHTARKFTGSLA